VIGYNSKVYYVITQGAGLGDNVRRVPITGNDTVLDALAAVKGLSQVSSTRMWIARPSPSNPRNGKILPVDYAGITQRGPRPRTIKSCRATGYSSLKIE